MYEYKHGVMNSKAHCKSLCDVVFAILKGKGLLEVW